MIRFNDVNRSIINLNYIEQMDLNPNLTFLLKINIITYELIM